MVLRQRGVERRDKMIQSSLYLNKSNAPLVNNPPYSSDPLKLTLIKDIYSISMRTIILFRLPVMYSDYTEILYDALTFHA